jgi:predicted O-linked N-acetylglucosamine transferase (SPINDLY family)
MSETQSTSVVDACGQAMDLQRAGHLDQAAALYRSILDTDPAHAVANHCLGMLMIQRRRAEEGLPLLLVALNLEPQVPDYWLGVIEAQLQCDDIGAAQETLTLGRRHGLAGRAVDELATRVATRGRPAPPAATAHAKSKQKVGASHTEWKLARQLRKQDAALATLIAQKRIADAVVLARSMTERFPRHGLAWKRLGALLWWQGQAESAVLPMQNAVRLLPNDAEAHSNLGLVSLLRKRRDEALVLLQRAVDLDPTFAAAHYHLGMTHLVEHRFADAESSLQRAVALRPDYLTTEVKPVHSDLLFMRSHNPTVDPDMLFSEHRRFGELIEPPDALRHRHTNSQDPERRLRIGFVSGDFQDHSVAMFLEPVVARLNRMPEFDLRAYYNHVVEDAVTRRLKICMPQWHPVSGLSDRDFVQRIGDDGIDILVDLSGHTSQNRLRALACKPAPVQVSWLGYPGTTGLLSMDYYLADAEWLPPGRFDAQFTEKLVHLPDRWAFVPHADAPPVNRLPALEHGRLTFGSFHRWSKINNATLAAWAALLRALPDSTLLLAPISETQQPTAIASFAAHGIDASRLKFQGRRSMALYLGLHNQVDIGLDTQPYAGATTSMHSLSMGVPTLTIAGPTAAAHAGAGINRHVGLEAFVAGTPAEFVERGLYWAQHLSELAAIRADLRSHLARSPGGQPDLIVRHLSLAFRHMWRRWCQELPAESFASAALDPSA